MAIAHFPSVLCSSIWIFTRSLFHFKSSSIWWYTYFIRQEYASPTTSMFPFVKMGKKKRRNKKHWKIQPENTVKCESNKPESRQHIYVEPKSCFTHIQKLNIFLGDNIMRRRYIYEFAWLVLTWITTNTNSEIDGGERHKKKKNETQKN